MSICLPKTDTLPSANCRSESAPTSFASLESGAISRLPNRSHAGLTRGAHNRRSRFRMNLPRKPVGSLLQIRRSIRLPDCLEQRNVLPQRTLQVICVFVLQESVVHLHSRLLQCHIRPLEIRERVLRVTRSLISQSKMMIRIAKVPIARLQLSFPDFYMALKIPQG